MPPITTLTTVLFVLTLCLHSLVHNSLPEDSLHNSGQPQLTFCRDFNRSMCRRPDCRFDHCCEYCRASHPGKDCSTNGSINPLAKPQPWTPIRSFILEHELSIHPDKAFVKQLIYDLQHGCAIGYNGPQFANLAKNLPSAYQQPEVIDATLKKECDAGRILGPFSSPPLHNLCTSGLGLIPKHDGGWRIIYHLSAPTDYSNTISMLWTLLAQAFEFEGSAVRKLSR